MPREAARKTVVHLADGRELIYSDSKNDTDRAARSPLRAAGA
jgi:hypothetical protein